MHKRVHVRVFLRVLLVCNVCVSAGQQSRWKDLVLGLSILMALGGCWFAYAQTRKSRDDLGKLVKDLESLQRAEQSLLDLQEKYVLQHHAHTQLMVYRLYIKDISILATMLCFGGGGCDKRVELQTVRRYLLTCNIQLKSFL